jgi:EEF1A lysine methyltransferase 1
VPDIPAQILEFDKRFEQYGDDFIFYDYNQPEELPSALKHSYGIIVADPPYLVSVPYLVKREIIEGFLVFLYIFLFSLVYIFNLIVESCFIFINSYLTLVLLQSKECLEKMAKTISFLAKPQDSFLLLLTGNCSYIEIQDKDFVMETDQ